MPKLILDDIPKINDIKSDFKYSDLHLDLVSKYSITDNFNNEGEINDFKVDYDYDAIRNSLFNLFSTVPGQKLLNPEFGLDFRKYLFDPLTKEMALDIRGNIFAQVRRYEPRVTLTSVNITIYEDDNEMDIDIFFDIPALNINNATIFGALDKNGYYLRKF